MDLVAKLVRLQIHILTHSSVRDCCQFVYLALNYLHPYAERQDQGEVDLDGNAAQRNVTGFAPPQVVHTTYWRCTYGGIGSRDVWCVRAIAVELH